jgi:hypothetical protein
MLDRLRRLPSPALVISAIALVFAVGGGTFAIAASSGSGQTKKIAKKVANQQINLRASSLSVSHAKTADSATNAGHAANADHAGNADHATNADHAGDADHAASADHATSADSATDSGELGGQPASAYARAVPFNFVGGYGSNIEQDDHPLVTIGGITIGVRCMNNGSNLSETEVWLVSPSNGHAVGSWTRGVNEGAGTTTFVDEEIGSAMSLPTPIAGPTRQAFAGSVTYSDSQGNVTVSFGSEVSSFLTSCIVHGLAVTSG